MSTNVTPTLLTAAEAASILRISRQSVYRAVASGHLEAFRLGEAGSLRIPAHALVEHLRRAAPSSAIGQTLPSPPGAVQIDGAQLSSEETRR